MKRWSYLGIGLILGLILPLSFLNPGNPPQSEVTESDVLPAELVGAGESIEETEMQEGFAQETEALETEVIRVIDGDTIETTVGQVRILGIQTPERGECGFDSAFARLFQLVKDKKITLVLKNNGKPIDNFGRLLAFIELNAVDIGKQLIEEGEATANRKYPSIRDESYLQAEDQARSSGAGTLWSTCFPIVPSPTPPSTTSSDGEETQTACSIKGNISSKGEKVYHLPGCGSYERTVIDESVGERWFCSESEAISAGWRKAGNC